MSRCDDMITTRECVATPKLPVASECPGEAGDILQMRRRPRTERKRHTRTQTQSRAFARSLSQAPSESKDETSSMNSTSSLVKRFFTASWRAADAAAAYAASERPELPEERREAPRVPETSESKECRGACCEADEEDGSVSTVSALDEDSDDDWEPSHCVYIVGSRDTSSEGTAGSVRLALGEVLDNVPGLPIPLRPSSAESVATSEARVASPDASATPSVRLCEICYARSVEDDWTFCGECDFAVCMTCSVRHVETQVSRTGRSHCLDWRCSAEVPDEKLETMLDESQLEKLHRLRNRRSADKHECPMCNEFSGHEEGHRRFGCDHCREDSCKNCKRPWGRMDCKAHLCSPEPAEFAFWRIGRNVRHCPKCRNVIEKNGGCPHMTCIWCGFEFMWCCKQSYGNHDAELCTPLCVVKSRNPLFGPTKPVRAVTKGAVIVVGGATVVALGTVYGALYLAPREGVRLVYRAARRSSRR